VAKRKKNFIAPAGHPTCSSLVTVCETKNALPLVLYGCETWHLVLLGELRLRIFQNRVLRRKFGPKREELG
jgi:hypothetical protein